VGFIKYGSDLFLFFIMHERRTIVTMDNTEQIKVKEEKKDIWKPFIKLLFKARLPYIWIILITILTLSESTLTLMLPDLTKYIVGGNITNKIIFGAIAVIIGKIMLTGIIRFISKVTMYKIDKSYRRLIWKQLMVSPVRLFDKVKANEMVSRTSTDTAKISTVFSYVVPTFISIIYMSVGTVTVLFGYDWRLGLAQAIFIPMYFGFYLWYGRWSYRVNKLLQSKLANLTQFLSELLVNIPLIKMFVTEKKEDDRGKENIQSYYKASVKKGLANWIEHPMTGLFGVLQSVLVIGLGVYFVSRGDITIDVWVAYFLYVDLLYGVLGTFGFLFIELKVSQGATSRLAQLIEHPEEVYKREFPLSEVKDDLVFDHVNFSYGDEKVLSNVSFTIPHGKVSAIVGPSGSGKTTILSLIEQFYEADAQTIRLGDTPIEDYHLDDWRNAFGYVAQDIPLLTGTVRENILYGVDRDVSETELTEAAKQANALEFIRDLSGGFDAYIGESGKKLSGGQRQRLAIARVILRNPQFLLLDEATSNLDTKSEQAVQEALSKLMQGRTTIIIAHDLSIVRDADQIIVVDGGTVTGTGKHEELVETNEMYRKFVQLHLGHPAI